MARFKHKKESGVQEISTAALPDIIFMLLFFFMVTTVMRESEVFVDYKLPVASEVQKLQDKSAVSTIYVGKPKMTDEYGTLERIQFNGVIQEDLASLSDFIIIEKDNIAIELKDKFVLSLKIDKESNMGVVSDLKQELRRLEQYRINYASKKQ